MISVDAGDQIAPAAQAARDAGIRTIFAQPNQEAAREQMAEVLAAMEPRWPKAAAVLVNGEEEVLTYMTFPIEHWTRIYPTNPLEQLNREVKRRTDAMSIFPDADSVLRLVGSILTEVHDEWQAGRRYFSKESMRKLKEPDQSPLALPTPQRLAPIR